MSGLQVFVYEPRITPVPVSGLNPGCSPGLRGASCGRRGGGSVIFPVPRTCSR